MDDDDREYALYLNELYGDVSICGMEYPAGDALYEVDRTAFNVGMADWRGTVDDEDEDEDEDED